MNSIKSILIKYKNNRIPRCTSKMDNFLGSTLNFLDRTQRYGDFLKFNNVSECSVNNDQQYIRKHILEGLLVHDEMPDTHWHEYKDSDNQKGMFSIELAFKKPQKEIQSAKTIHKKVYETPHHEMSALAEWEDNLKRVAEHNQDYLAGKHSYALHLNYFGDMHVTEYFKKVLKLIKTIPLFDPAEDHQKTAYHRHRRCKVPKQLDWRSKGFRPKREEQFHCGACYAFAITHAMQAQLYKRHRDWKELSPQQIVDCSFKDGNMGCNGGSLKAALRYVSREGLIMEKHYPYIGKKGRCKYKRYYVSARPRRWATLPMGDEAGMEKLLSTVGPMAVAVNAAPFTFQLYRNGIYDDPFCTPWQLNHAMLLVGYTPQYWILLNWWGRNWGEDGYMRIRRGLNRCGVANMATYVEL